MNPKFRLLIYPIAVFVVFLALTWILRAINGNLPIPNGVWGIYKESDFLLGLVVAGVVTMSHIQKRKLK